MSSRTRAPGVIHLLLGVTLACGGLPTGSPGPEPSDEEPTAEDRDDFGTRNLYPSEPQGRKWAARWNEHPRTLKALQVDPYDPEFQMRGSQHTLEILGDGTARSSGEIIRFYIGTPDKTWLNTELTMYAMRVSETSWDPGSSGFEFQTRTGDGHLEKFESNPAGLDRRCDGHAYSYALRFDGRAVLEKELKHPVYTNQVTALPWKGQPLPRGTWVGIKVITYDLPGGQVKQELWLDLTDGANGGTWEKVHEHIDAGGWSIPPEVAATCRIAPDQRITTPEPFIILRNQDIREQWYKKVTIREIQPPTG
ncbi:hypothetical protein [Vitiosangium sp. GDMCC 1.1324]|uniref:hypothetical protein n=1 Tax=Vitiosangium sp. (strain GDMCC 1.1324) TaxID=2138576 RepID=UPI000D346F43|nr:hypothetical protein [Vitiosangium sp. GDMCC 1.1324]